MRIVFFRTVENRIQQYADIQTHDLPKDELQRNSLAYAFGYSDWSDFKSKLDGIRATVHEIFQQVIESPQTSTDDNSDIDWIEADSPTIMNQLLVIGYSDKDLIHTMICQFRISYSIRRITARGASELNKLIPLLLQASVKFQNSAETLARILKLIEAISGRNVYLTLLIENPLALSQLVKLASASSWIVNYIAQYPLLLDELLDPRGLYTPLTRAKLLNELVLCLSKIDCDDIEQFMTALRQFKQANMLRIASAEIMGVISIVVVSDYLTWLAECIIECVLLYAWKLTEIRHGPPLGATSGEIKGFGVIAYGKMGSKELSYASDLDLVFLYGGVEDTALTCGANPIACAQFYVRVVKRMITILTTQILSGTLYEIDLRLRPSGNSGLLVSSLDAYEKYQMESSWTWEQQALVRARFVAGDPEIARSFAMIRRRSLGRTRDARLLRRDVLEMRYKMRESLEDKTLGRFDIKQASGGIADIEFIVQLAVLLDANKHECLLQWTDVLHLLDSLQETGFLDASEAVHLKEAFCLFRERTHKAALLEQSATVAEEEFSAIRSHVQSIWRAKLENDSLHT